MPRILFYDFGSYIFEDMKFFLEKEGFLVDSIYLKPGDRINNPVFSEMLHKRVRDNAYDFLFSVNFFPIMAVEANSAGIPYISLSYDSPLSEELIPYFRYDTNIICLFDRCEVAKYKTMGYSRVYHVPLAVNVGRLNNVISNCKESCKYESDFAFVGDLHISMLDKLLAPLSDYNKGYISALLNAQTDLYGSDIITPALSDSFINSVNSDYSKFGNSDSKLTKTGLSYAIFKELTHLTRVTLIEELSKVGTFKLYSYDDYPFTESVIKMGPVAYKSEMPVVFSKSRINLCPTLQSIQSGIPLRALDIMGSGGVLLCNYQSELYEEFEDGVDCLLYSGLDEAYEKACFYLNKETELAKIASSGKSKVERLHSYEGMINKILEIIRK